MSSVTIHTRTSWGARTPRPTRTPQSPRSIREFFIHWPGETGKFTGITAVRERAIMRETQDYHMDTHGWADIGYSFAVFQSGRIYRGRGMNYVPAAQLGHNTGTVGVCCMVGLHDEPTPELLKAVGELKHFCLLRAHAFELIVRPHKAVTSTDCPGPAMSKHIAQLQRA